MATLSTEYHALQSPKTTLPVEEVHPLDAAGFFAKLTFTWTNKLMKLGNERQLGPDDVWEIQNANKVSNLLTKFTETYYKKDRGIFKTFFSVYGVRLIAVAVMEVASAAADLFGPAYVLPQIIKVVESTPMDWTRGVLLVVALFAVQTVSSILKSQMGFINGVIGFQFTACLRSMLFEKALKLSAKSRKEKSTGDIANLFSVDVRNVMGFSTNLNMLWVQPIQIAITLYLIERQVGWAIWLGFAALFVIIILTGFVGNLAGAAQKLILSSKDNRMKVVNELFGAIQIVKFNAWEEKLSAKVIELRNKELAAIWSFIKTLLVIVTSMYTAPVLITVVVFATYSVWMGRVLTASIVFTTLALFKTLEQAFIALPAIFVGAIEAFVSAKRINEVLTMEEINVDNVLSPEDAEVMKKFGADETIVDIENGSFGWDTENPLFKDLNWRVKRGEFVVVHGTVGAGKSSLCSVLLGEMEKYNGSVFVGGRVAYFAQQSWILNTSVRENILFGKPYDPIKYRKVVEACALTKDIAALEAGDRTEIGLKGVNLSGGQKARVSLARACYSDADIYILDSPLSAVDAIVSQEIFTKCFLGLLKNKTVILITHNPDIIESAAIDRSFHLEDGKLVESTQDKPRSRPEDIPVSPLRARRGFWEADDELLDAPAPVIRQHELLITPSANTPYTFHESAMIFTPRRVSEVGTSAALVVEEERAEGRVSKAVVMSYLSAIGGCWAMFVMLFATVVTEGVRVTSDLWLSHWTNDAASKPPAEAQRESNKNMGIYSGLVVATCFLTIIQVGVVLLYGLYGSRTLFKGMLDGLIQAPMRFFDTNPIGRILNRFGDDVFQCDIAIPLSFAPILVETAGALSKMVTSVAVIQWMGLLLPLLIFVYYKLGVYYLAPIREANRIRKTALSPLLSLVSEAVDGTVVIRAFGDKYQRRFYRMHDKAINDYTAANFLVIALNQWFSLRVQIISNCIVFAILLGCIIINGKVSTGIIGLIITYGLNIPTNLANLVNMWASLETALISPERLHEYASIDKEGERNTPFDLGEWPTQGQIEVDSLSFRYKPDDPLVLKDVSFSIRGGEKIGIVGRTGAGKSSLMMALFRINDAATGSIKIDGIDIATIGLKQLRSSLAIIPQNPVLFKGTLRNYMDPFNEYDDAQLWDSLQKVNMTDRISTSDDKLEQIVEENGENFSVGERQMLCMARALLHHAKIVVLDEATAAIDHDTDQLLQKVIREEFASSTVLTIAHRLDTVLDYNRILVFDHGELAQCDTPHVLMAQGEGIFHEMITEGGYSERLAALSPKETV
ncbi:hypothetical protein AC1031_016377 [Aphanomyces cochlioides]|nr:hypothetical protein AC1031_016377 [Aphanomyces cochlioides]